MDILIEARYRRENAASLDRANILLKRLRFQMRLARDLKVLPVNSFEFQAKQALSQVPRPEVTFFLPCRPAPSIDVAAGWGRSEGRVGGGLLGRKPGRQHGGRVWLASAMR
jgi:hypothetical protein